MDGFGDLLEDIKNDGGELIWVSKKKNFLENNFNKKRTPEQIKQEVLKSQTIRHAVDQILEKSQKNESDGWKTLKKEDIYKEAQEIINEMAHNFDLKYVRGLGYVLMKVFCKIYNHIYYNKDITANMEILKHSPCLLLPLHRSYMDFLLVSIICFHKNIQMPAIATGMDFMGLKFLSDVLSRCGGFFIRRSFGSDQLYWAIFNEYVQAHLLNCDRPLEFFIEGTRSRTSKSLPPKHGMLASCLELYLKEHRVYDIYLVPISLTYERLLEEVLYSSELLGIPKPKESVSGLVKARSILNQCYGSIFINFGKPLSFREMIFQLKGGVGLYSSLTPNFVFELNDLQINMIQSVCYTALIVMLNNQIIQPISLIATCLISSINKQCNEIGTSKWSHSISFERILNQIEDLKRILTNLGCKVYWPVNESSSIRSIILDNLETHSNLFDLYDSGNKSHEFEKNIKEARSDKLLNNNDKIIIALKKVEVSKEYNQEQIFEDAKNYLSMCSYRNQLVCFLVRKSFACNALLAMNTTDKNQLEFGEDSLNKAFNVYEFLSKLFNREYIFKSGDEKQDFNDSINYLLHTNIFKKQENEGLELIKLNLNNFLFMSRLFLSTMQNYSQIYTILSSQAKSDFDDEKQLLKFIQEQIFEKLKITKGSTSFFDLEILSLNLISNSMLALIQFDILKKSKVNGKIEFKFKLSLLKNLNINLVNIINQNHDRLQKLDHIASECDYESRFNLKDSRL